MSTDVRGRIRAVHPVLPVRDMARSLEFYRALGFTLLFGDPEGQDAYAGVGRDAVELHLQTHAPEEWDREGVDRPLLRFAVEDPDPLHAAFAPLGVFHAATELRDTAWGTREFGFYDPDGNGLIFYADLPADGP